jgi:hypothetical protein
MNRYEIYDKGEYITITRRFLRGKKELGHMRVRMTAKDILGNVLYTVFQDFTDMHEGDQAFSEWKQREYRERARS